MKVNCAIILCMFLIMACTNVTPRKPVKKNTSSSLNSTVEFNKKLINEEDKRIEQYIKLDSSHTYYNSKKGFWYAYITKKEGLSTAIKGDIVTFEQEIFSLNGNLLYSKEELGVQRYVVDKEHVIRGIKEGIKIMKTGEEILFVLSSFVAYRTKGDLKKKIGGNEPIVTKIKIININ